MEWFPVEKGVLLPQEKGNAGRQTVATAALRCRTQSVGFGSEETWLTGGKSLMEWSGVPNGSVFPL